MQDNGNEDQKLQSPNVQLYSSTPVPPPPPPVVPVQEISRPKISRKKLLLQY